MICLKNKQVNKKDYSEIIGKRYGELTILSYTEPLKKCILKECAPADAPVEKKLHYTFSMSLEEKQNLVDI